MAARRLLAYSVSPTVLISGRLRPEIKVAFIPGLRYMSMFAGGSARAIVDSTATGALSDP
jgi:hypothetical protein